MNWVLIFSMLALTAPISIYFGLKQPRTETGEASWLAQLGYFSALIGICGLLAQFLSLDAVMLTFIVVSLIVGIFYLRQTPKSVRDTQAMPDHVEYTWGFFPVIMVVFCIRVFVFEPFVIPSASMYPTLHINDFIVVNKFAYGVKLPIIGAEIFPTGKPQRGDVMVFEYPNDRSMNYIKRTIGLPGDVVEYKNKQLRINGVLMAQDAAEKYDLPSIALANTDGNYSLRPSMEKRQEMLGQVKHEVLVDLNQPDFSRAGVDSYRVSGLSSVDEGNCTYGILDDPNTYFKCTVPTGKYFMMGDNRDMSGDSRYWGFVPTAYIKGKASYIWMNMWQFNRIGTKIQ